MANAEHHVVDFPTNSRPSRASGEFAAQEAGYRQLFLLQGPSLAASRVREQIARIGPHFRCALLTGPNGCGADAAAQMLQAYSPASGFRLQVLDAEAAEQVLAPLDRAGQPQRLSGLMFLQELTKLSKAAQRALLRALRSGGLHQLRVIAYATHDARALAASGTLLSELAELFGGVQITLPELQERRDDLPFLAEAMVTRHAIRRGSGPVAMDSSFYTVLALCEWSGNLPQLNRVLRELVNSAQDPVLNGVMLRAAYEATSRRGPLPSPESLSIRLEDVMQRHVRKVLLASGGNKLRAAEALGISRSTLYRMLDSVACPESSVMRLVS